MTERATLANWRTAPHHRWAFHHVRELIPSADIPHDPRRVRELAPGEGGADPALERFLAATDTDAIAVLRRGRLALERYANGMSGETPHILMSVSKSMLGLLVGELGLDTARQVTDILPELRDTAYRGATLQQLLDMRAGLRWDENYLAAEGPIVEYRKATGWNPSEQPGDLHSFFSTLTEAERPHGGRFHYTSPNSDLLGWAIERATSARYAELMSELIWKPAGAERSAYITVDRLGAPRCAGGMCTTLRDLVRVGLWAMEAGKTEPFERDGDAQAWAEGDLAGYYPGLPMRYRNQWYVLDAAAGDGPLAFGMGIHGQNLFIDRARELVIVKFSSWALPMDEARIALTMRGIAELRRRFG